MALIFLLFCFWFFVVLFLYLWPYYFWSVSYFKNTLDFEEEKSQQFQGAKSTGKLHWHCFVLCFFLILYVQFTACQTLTYFFNIKGKEPHSRQMRWAVAKNVWF